jgi:hypothetical protein
MNVKFMTNSETCFEMTEILKELSQYSDIFRSSEREEVDITCVQYYVYLAGKKLKNQGGIKLLDWIYSKLDDTTKEIEFEWSKLS